MPDPLTLQQRHLCMSHIRSKDTNPELKVRRELWRRGYRYRMNVCSLPGTPDIVLGRYRSVIFVNGCFWHGHGGCRKYTVPKSNVEFWKEKVARNRERDLLNNQRLESIAWGVITVWECELDKAHLPDTIDRVEAELQANKAKWEAYSQRRREDRQFALEQARKRREIAALVAAELSEQLDTPVKFRKITYDDEY